MGLSTDENELVDQPLSPDCVTTGSDQNAASSSSKAYITRVMHKYLREKIQKWIYTGFSILVNLQICFIK